MFIKIEGKGIIYWILLMIVIHVQREIIKELIISIIEEIRIVNNDE